jgi:signal transduction histidine kinase
MAADPFVPHPRPNPSSAQPEVRADYAEDLIHDLHADSTSESDAEKQRLIQHNLHLQHQLQQQHWRQQLFDRLISAGHHGADLTQIYRLATNGLVQVLQASRGLLLLFKYADPRHRSSTVGNIARTKATIVAESWANGSHPLTNPATEPVNQSGAPNCGMTDLPMDGVDSTPESRTDGSQTLSFWASDCNLCQSILLGQPDLVISGVLADLEPGQSDSLFQRKNLPAILMLPLESQGTILGCLVLQQNQPRRWDGDEVGFVRLIAAQLSNAIIQTRSFQQVQAVVQERTAQLQRSLEVQAKLYEKTRQQVEQLRKLNEEREEFLSTISHELLTPLTSMTLAIRMLRQADSSVERRLKYLDILEKQCVQETNLINDLLALRKLEMNTAVAQMQKLDLCQLIQEVVQTVEPTWQEKNINISVELPPHPLTLYSDSDSLSRILQELLTNAKKYADPSSTITLKVSLQPDITVRQVVLSVCNIGPGIAPDELPHIFEKFRRGRGVTKQAIQGTGLGLALVKSLVEHLDAAIAVSSHALEESTTWQTCFTLTLPQNIEGQIHASA